MIRIIGYESVVAMQAFDPVKSTLNGLMPFDVYLGAFLAKPLGIDLSGKVIYNMEYLHDESPPFDYGYFDVLKSTVVLDFSRRNVEWLKSKGIDAFYMPYGFSREIDAGCSTEKDIDVLFVGSERFERRKAIFKKLEKQCHLVVADGVYGDNLDALVSRSKVHLNMHHKDGQPLESVRLNYLLSMGCCVVSERGSDPLFDSRYSEALTFSAYDIIDQECIRSLVEPPKHKNITALYPQCCDAAIKWVENKLCRQFTQPLQ